VEQRTKRNEYCGSSKVVQKARKITQAKGGGKGLYTSDNPGKRAPKQSFVVTASEKKGKKTRKRKRTRKM